MPGVSSFDVFDTSLTRLTGSPASLFTLLGRRLRNASLLDCSPEAFARARIRAEGRAISNQAGREFNLHEIYRELGATYGWTESERSRVAEWECALERDLIRAIPAVRERAERARARGDHVAFLSDMYLPVDFIKGELARHGLWKEGDSCLVSSESGKFKKDGGLFQCLMKTLGPGAGAITHLGDNHLADVETPRRLGIQAAEFSDAALNRFERILEAYTWDTEGLSSLLAGASRMARLTVPTHSAQEAALRDVTAGVMAPTLTGYVLWILRRAQESGVKRIYFVSRDGQILKQIAGSLATKLRLDFELRYIYGSRQAWHLAAVESIGENELSWILEDSDGSTVRRVLSRVGLVPEDEQPALASVGLGRADWDRRLSDNDRVLLRRFLEGHGVQTSIVQQAHSRRRQLVQYLLQEGLFAQTPSALVEIGWRGRMQRSLTTVVTAQGGVPPRFFYFGLASNPTGSTEGLRETYFFDAGQKTGYLGAVPGVYTIIETFCAAEHGITLGYEARGKETIPVLRGEANDKVIQWGLPLVRRTAEAFLDNFICDPELVNWGGDLRAASAEVMRAFWLNPCRHEAAAWGNFPYEDDQGGDSWFPLAEPYHIGDIRAAFRCGRNPVRNRTSWVAGSLALTPRIVRAGLRLGAFAGRLTGRASAGGRRALKRILRTLGWAADSTVSAGVDHR